MDIKEFREQFAQLGDTVYSKPLVYLDSAATSLRPAQVIDTWSSLAAHCSANIHRAVHYTATRATQLYEKARKAVAEYIGASSEKEIIFTSGTTASLNLLAYSYGAAYIREGDEIIISASEHHSNIVPWQLLCERTGATIKVWEVDEYGRLDLDVLRALMTPRTKLCCVAAISNVLGLINPVKEIINICHTNSCKVICDCAQALAHISIDVRDWDCDFLVFSGHKAYAAPGTGVLYGKKELLDAMPPFMGGGEMIKSVSWKGTSYADVPMRFEAGTQNYTSVPTFIPALEVLESSFCEDLENNMASIRDYVLDALMSDKRIHLYGIPENREEKIALFSFSVEHCHHEDLALILDKMGIAVRSGQMCAEPLMDRFRVTGMLRASFAPYNTLDEAKIFIESLDRAIKLLRA